MLLDKKKKKKSTILKFHQNKNYSINVNFELYVTTIHRKQFSTLEDGFLFLSPLISSN